MPDEPESLDDNLDGPLQDGPDGFVARDELERRALARCPHCGSPNIRLSHNEGIKDKFLRMFGRRAYRCRDCRDRFHASGSLLYK